MSTNTYKWKQARNLLATGIFKEARYAKGAPCFFFYEDGAFWRKSFYFSTKKEPDFPSYLFVLMQ